MVKEIQPLSVEDVSDVQLEGGMPDMAEQRRQGWWCGGCYYCIYAGVFIGIIAKNFVQFVVFCLAEPNLWYYFIIINTIWVLGCILYCIAGCCKAEGLVKFLEPTCPLINLGVSIFGAVTFFGSPWLKALIGEVTAEELKKSIKDPVQLASFLQVQAEAAKVLM